MVKFIYNDGGRLQAGYKGQTGDCVCRAICIATGKPYQEVYDILSSGNSTQRKGKREGAKAGKKTASKGISVKRDWFKKYMDSLGFEWTPTMLIGQGCKTHLKAEELPMGVLICTVSKHWVAVVDGIINDTYDCSRGGTRCVYGYYKLNKK